MKRGFLLRAEEKKAAAKRRDAQKQTETSTSPTGKSHNRTSDLDKDERLISSQKLAYGHLTDEEKALPSDYDPNQSKFVPVEIDSRTIEVAEDARLITSIPQPCPDDEIQSEWIVNGSTKGKVLNAPGYPARIPKPRRPDLYELRQTPDMGQGLFAKHSIKRGDLIFAERPLLVVPHGLKPLSKGPIPGRYTPRQISQVTMHEFEGVLKYAVGRLPPESQADFNSLHNAHTDDGSGPILGIVRSNAYGIPGLYDGSNKIAKYGAICKIGSRLNHSCIPNVHYYFKLNSFSTQFYALRDIKTGEQLFYSYCSADVSVTERQAELAPYGFMCKCLACVNATPETDTLRGTFKAQVAQFQSMVENSSKIDETMLKDAVRLGEDMNEEGLDSESEFVELLMAISLAYGKIGKVEDSERYGIAVEGFKGCFQAEE